MARSYGLKFFKAESIDDLTVDQYGLLVGHYTDEHEKNLKEYKDYNPKTQSAGRSNSATIRISNTDQ